MTLRFDETDHRTTFKIKPHSDGKFKGNELIHSGKLTRHFPVVVFVPRYAELCRGLDEFGQLI